MKSRARHDESAIKDESRGERKQFQTSRLKRQDPVTESCKVVVHSREP